MNAAELIAKHTLVLAPEIGPDAIKVVISSKRPKSAAEAEPIKAAKAAILELLRAQQAEQKARDAQFAVKGAERVARQAAEFEAVKAEQLPALLAQIPEGAVRVTVTEAEHDHNADVYWVGERKIFHMDVTFVGLVKSGHRKEIVAYMSGARLAELEQADVQRADAETAATETRTAKFAEAARTLQPVFLSQDTAECSNPELDCSFDFIAHYAMPDGSISSQRTHTH